MTNHSKYAANFRAKQKAAGLVQFNSWVRADQLDEIKAMIKQVGEDDDDDDDDEEDSFNLTDSDASKKVFLLYASNTQVNAEHAISEIKTSGVHSDAIELDQVVAKVIKTWTKILSMLKQHVTEKPVEEATDNAKRAIAIRLKKSGAISHAA